MKSDRLFKELLSELIRKTEEAGAHVRNVTMDMGNKTIIKESLFLTFYLAQSQDRTDSQLLCFCALSVSVLNWFN